MSSAGETPATRQYTNPWATHDGRQNLTPTHRHAWALGTPYCTAALSDKIGTVTNPGQNPAPGRLPHVALVAGPRTIELLGPVLRHLVVGLLDEPMEVTLVHPLEADTSSLPSPPLGLRPWELPHLPFLRRRRLAELVEDLAADGIDVLHALDAEAVALTRYLAEGLDVDYVASLYEPPASNPSLGPSCRAVLAASLSVAQALRRMRLPEEMVRLVRPGVLPARRAAGLLDLQHAVGIVASGRLQAYGPLAAVMEAFARLRQERADCAFFMVGAGRAEPALRRLARRLGLMTDLTFVDRQDYEQLCEILRAADVFVWPAPSGRVDVEPLLAMAAGVPVLAGGAGADDFIDPGVTAELFSPLDAADLARKLSLLLRERARTRSLAEGALAHVRQHHSATRMTAACAGVYRSLLGARAT